MHNIMRIIIPNIARATVPYVANSKFKHLPILVPYFCENSHSNYSYPTDSFISILSSFTLCNNPPRHMKRKRLEDLLNVKSKQNKNHICVRKML